MKKNIFTTFLSYFFDIPIETIDTNYNNKINVSLSSGQYKLSTQNAIYSFGNKYTSFATTFDKTNIYNQKIETVLLLGVGLGSIIQLLEKNKNIQQIIAVDIDEKINQLAQKHLQSSLKEKTTFITADAIEFIGNCNQKFDLILFDVFIDDTTPEIFINKNFIQALKNCLSKNGKLIWSKIDVTINHKMENADFESMISKSAFSNYQTIDTNGNKVYYCF